MSNAKIIYKPLTDLRPWAKNARTHSKKQIRQIANSIKEFGFTNPVLIDVGNVILAGHGRVEGARFLGMSEVPCVVLDYMSASQKRAYVLADNKLALNAGWDDELLAEELSGHCQIKLICYDELRIWVGFENRCLIIYQAIQRTSPNL